MEFKQKPSILDKINPIWWIKNSDDPIENNPKRFPGKPLWLRRILWAIRNPFSNFTRYVIGLADRQHLVQFGQTFVKGGGWIIILPFISFNGRHIRGYAGWVDGISFGLELKKSKILEDGTIGD